MSTLVKESFPEEFLSYVKSSQPYLWIKSYEEVRVTQEVLKALKDTKVLVNVYRWDSERKLCKYDRLSNNNKGGWTNVPNPPHPAPGYDGNNVITAISKLGASNERSIVLMLDFHPYIKAPGNTRQIRNAIDDLKSKGNMIVFVSPLLQIPVELKKEIQLLDFNLPDAQQLEGIIVSIQNSLKRSNPDGSKAELSPDVKIAAIEASKGLTFSEAHDAFALSIVKNGCFNDRFVHSVFREKVKQVKEAGLLTYIEPDVTFDNIGGLDDLKEWIRMRSKVYTNAAREYGLPYSKGVLLAGWPGAGKSLIAKATANEFGFPLYLLDIGSLFGSLVGETERNTRNVVETLDSIGRCVVLID